MRGSRRSFLAAEVTEVAERRRWATDEIFLGEWRAERMERLMFVLINSAGFG
jgi:hypothetical protein